jgi:hypothetical protein
MTTDRRQGLIGNLGIKKAVKVATTATISLEGLQTIDNVALAEGDRVLVKNQADLTTNGIYDVSSGSWTRSLDFDGNGDIVNGTLIFVTNGSVNASRLFSTVVTDPITVGSSNIQFNFAIAFGDTGLIASNNLSDVPNKSTARDNLGLEIGTDIPSYFDVSKYASGNFYIDSSVSANTYVLTKTASLVNPVDGSNNYYIGMTIKFRPNYNNTGASTVNVNSAGVKNLKKEDGTTNVTTGDITTTKDVEFRYDGTNFVQSNSIVLATNSVRGISFLSNPITISNNATDANNDIDFSAGNAPLDDGSGQVILSSLMTKRLDASWSAGTNNGGLFSGTKANSTWYYAFVIQNTSTGAVDAGFDSSAIGANVPSGWKISKMIHCFRTDSSGNILNGTYLKDGWFYYNTSQTEYTTTSTVATNITLSFTPAIISLGHMSTNSVNNGSTGVRQTFIGSLSSNLIIGGGVTYGDTYAARENGQMPVPANRSVYVSTSGTGTSTIRTHGFKPQI